MMSDKIVAIKQNFHHCILEKIEDDEANEYGYYASKYFFELVEIFKCLLEEKPSAVENEVIRYKHNRELQMMLKESGVHQEKKYYHYSERIKHPNTGMVEQDVLRIDYYDSLEIDPNRLVIEIVKLLKFRNIGCMDKIEGIFKYDVNTKMILPVTIEYDSSDEYGNYKRIKMQPDCLKKLQEVIEVEKKIR